LIDTVAIDLSLVVEGLALHVEGGWDAGAARGTRPRRVGGIGGVVTARGAGQGDRLA
jgi:hypothetical protein